MNSRDLAAFQKKNRADYPLTMGLTNKDKSFAPARTQSLASSLVSVAMREGCFSLASKILVFRSLQIAQYTRMMRDRIPFTFAEFTIPIIFPNHSFTPPPYAQFRGLMQGRVDHQLISSQTWQATRQSMKMCSIVSRFSVTHWTRQTV
jgi:hypothetical protein